MEWEGVSMQLCACLNFICHAKPGILISPWKGNFDKFVLEEREIGHKDELIATFRFSAKSVKYWPQLMHPKIAKR